MRTPTISLFPTPSNFRELVTSTTLDGYIGIRSTNEMDVCCPNHSFSPKPNKDKGSFLTRFLCCWFLGVVLLPLMLSIGTSGVELPHKTEPLGVTFRWILESKLKHSIWGCINRGYTTEGIVLFPNFTFNKRRFF